MRAGGVAQALAVGLLLAQPALAQTASEQASAAETALPGDALAWMIGRWRGDGWTIDATRQRESFDIFEEIRVGSHGEAVILFGEGFSPAGSGRSGTSTHNATGMITRKGDGYEMRSVTSQGHQQDAVMTISDDGFAWSVSLGPHGRLDYEARHVDGVWEETGAYCPPAGACQQNFYMRLTRAD
tara:strand:+ start:302 stop:853 length:552 start_codon:yes stop_codon:yes gene_type:complete